MSRESADLKRRREAKTEELRLRKEAFREAARKLADESDTASALVAAKNHEQREVERASERDRQAADRHHEAVVTAVLILVLVGWIAVGNGLFDRTTPVLSAENVVGWHETPVCRWYEAYGEHWTSRLFGVEGFIGFSDSQTKILDAVEDWEKFNGMPGLRIHKMLNHLHTLEGKCRVAQEQDF